MHSRWPARRTCTARCCWTWPTRTLMIEATRRRCRSNTDSLAEQIQRTFPDAMVVKALNMVTVEVMTHPERLPEDTTTFVAGDDPEAKATVAAGPSVGDPFWTLAASRRPEPWRCTVHCGYG